MFPDVIPIGRAAGDSRLVRLDWKALRNAFGAVNLATRTLYSLSFVIK